MALDRVVKDIVESARLEADALIESAEKERAAILTDTDERISKIRKTKEKELEDALRRLRRQEISSAELEAKKIVLNKKKEILDRSFEETLNELSSMPLTEKRRIYSKSVASAQKGIPRPRAICPRGEKDLLAGTLDLTSVTETDMETGLILENADGSIRLDYRFRILLEGIWERELRQISNILFG